MRAIIFFLPIFILSICVSLLQAGTNKEVTESAVNRETIFQAAEFPIHRTEQPYVNQTGKITEFCQTPLDSVELDSLIIDFMDTYHTAGLSGSIVKNGQVIWTRAYGYAYIEPPILLTDSTLFMLASVSKTVTAVALMQLYDQGEFDRASTDRG